MARCDIAHGRANMVDPFANARRCRARLGGERFDLARDHREALPRLARARRLYACVERQHRRRAGTGIESDQRSGGLGSAEFDIDRLYGGYFRLSVPVADLFRPYAIVGYSESRGTTSIRSGGALVSRSTDTVGDQSYGVGVDASLAGAIGFNVEYMRYLDKDDYQLNAISVGIRSGF